MKKIIQNNYSDPELNDIEIIERKGLGHPDSLADMLAKECSRVYSEYCMNKFGCILHHNFDKLYIGGGCFRYENGKAVMYDKVKVHLNGRASNKMNGEEINLNELLVPVIKEYLSSVLPRLDVEKEVEISIDCTQNTKIPNWFSPESIEDVPDAKKLFANDTSLCVSYFPLTTAENLALEIERFFWNFSTKYPTPKFDNVGQDIKIMLFRIKNDINVTVCLPIFNDKFNNHDEYTKILKEYEYLLSDYVKKIVKEEKYNITIEINRYENGDYRDYTLMKGSCIECGEEGVVGRGNNSTGLISSFRQHTMEAPFGKNERYHTGRVLSFLGNKISLRLYNECNLKNTVYILTRNRNPLMQPYLLYLSINENVETVDKNKIDDIINEELDEKTYIKKILGDGGVY